MQPRGNDQQAFAPKRRAGWALLLCLVLGFGQFCFVRERRRPVPIKKGTQQGLANKDPKMITSKIRNTQAAGELLDVLDSVVDKPIFNYIQPTPSWATCRRRASWAQRRFKAVSWFGLSSCFKECLCEKR